MTRQLPSDAGRHCDNGKTCDNVSFHDLPPIASGRLFGVIGKRWCDALPSRRAAERTIVLEGPRFYSRPRTVCFLLQEIINAPTAARRHRRVMMWNRLALIGVLVAAVGGGAARAAPGAIEPKADAALHRMSDYLSGLDTFRVETNTVD